MLGESPCGIFYSTIYYVYVIETIYKVRIIQVLHLTGGDQSFIKLTRSKSLDGNYTVKPINIITTHSTYSVIHIPSIRTSSGHHVPILQFVFMTYIIMILLKLSRF